MLNTDLCALEPDFADAVRHVISDCANITIYLMVVETVRSGLIQAAYFAQGREPLDVVNAKRKMAGLPALTIDKGVITYCDGVIKKSAHQAPIGAGRAVDLIPFSGNRALWNTDMDTWCRIAEIAEPYGVDWCAGGDGAVWGNGWDWDHFEWNPTLKVK